MRFVWGHVDWIAYRMMMVSSRNNWSSSIVTELRFVTKTTSCQYCSIYISTRLNSPELSSEAASSTINWFGLQKNSGGMDKLRLQFLWSQNGSWSVIWIGLIFKRKLELWVSRNMQYICNGLTVFKFLPCGHSSLLLQVFHMERF